MGLLLGEALTDAEVSARISARQTHRYEGEESLRAAFAVGQDMARSGELGRLKSAGTGSVLVATRRSQRETLSQGRRTQRARRRARLEHLIATAGFGDLGGLLQARYCGGATLESLAVETGLGRAALRAALDEAGVVMRPTGHNTPQGRRSRSRTADQAAAQRVGTDDLSTWLRSRREQGWTLAQLGAAVGHSGHWVRWRLDPARPNPADPADPADLADPAEPVEVTR